MGAPETIDVDMTLRMLTDGSRRTILRVIHSGPQPVSAVAQVVRPSQQTAPHHLQTLQKAGLTTVTTDRARCLYILNTDGLAVVRFYLDGFWPEGLTALKVAVEQRREKQHD